MIFMIHLYLQLSIFELNATQLAQTHVTRKGCKVVYIPKLINDLCAGRVENKRLCMRNKILRSANTKNELKFMNKKDLPVMYSSVLWCLLSCYCFFFFLALLHNHCSSLKRRKSKLGILIWQGPGPVTTKMPFFLPKFNPLQSFSAPAPKRKTQLKKAS